MLFTSIALKSRFAESIGVQVLRAYGASINMFRLMMKISDSNMSSFIWYWTLNRWISARFNLLSSAVVGITGVVCLISSRGSSVYSTIRSIATMLCSSETNLRTTNSRSPETVPAKDKASWPSEGAIDVSGLVIRYAPSLPNVLHGISFRVGPREKVGIVGATGEHSLSR
jgi:ABC-type multidrug transport system fused ATPase/permease subunit